MGQAKAIKFTDLEAWKAGHKLVADLCRLTKSFPASEQFGLTSQMRRAAVSVTSNIAEGFTRQTKADKVHFYVMAHASLTELQNQLLIARDVEFISPLQCRPLASQTVQVHKLLTGLIKAIKA